MEEGPDPLRQCSSDLSHQPAGRDKIPIPLVGDMGPLPVVQIEQSVPEGGSPPRFGERHRGHPVEISTKGVVVTRPGGRTDLPGTRIPGDRSVRIQLEPQARLLRVQVPQPRGLGNRRSLPRLEPSKRLRFSTVCSGGISDPTGVSATLPRGTDRTVLALATLVPPTTNTSSSCSENSASLLITPDPAVREGTRPTRDSTFGCVEAVRRSLREEGFSEEAAALAVHGRRDFTIRLYDPNLRLYGEWCENQQVSPSQGKWPTS